MYFLSFRPVESLRVERRKPESSPPEADQVVGTNMDSGFHRSDDFLRDHHRLVRNYSLDRGIYGGIRSTRQS